MAFPPAESVLLFSTINGFRGGVRGGRSFARINSARRDSRSNLAFGLTPTAQYMAITFKQKPGNKDNRGSAGPPNREGGGMQLHVCAMWKMATTHC